MGQVRIIGGIHRSRILKFKDDIDGLRPTPDRVRETLFNWLGQTLTGKKCLDLFTGSGALGFEAMSRNAKSVVMVERNRNICNDLKNNVELLKAENIAIRNYDAFNYLSQGQESFDIIFVDPPYDSDLLNKCLQLLPKCKLVDDNTIIYIEYQTMPDLTAYSIIKEGKAGSVHYALLKTAINLTDIRIES